MTVKPASENLGREHTDEHLVLDEEDNGWFVHGGALVGRLPWELV